MSLGNCILIFLFDNPVSVQGISEHRIIDPCWKVRDFGVDFSFQEKCAGDAPVTQCGVAQYFRRNVKSS